MLKIYLARHGQNKDNAEGILNGRRDEPLTEKGFEQARDVAGKIKDKGIRFDHVYSSPLKRAYQTAEIICDALEAAEAEILPDLIERNFGTMTGQLQSRIKELCSPDIVETDTTTYFLNPEGAETFPQLIQRAKRLLIKLRGMHSDENILLVTHGDIGKMIYAAYYDLNWMDMLKGFHFGNSDLLELSEESGPEETHVFKIQQRNH
jgi:broad specificity phosphatase PhoE